MAVSLGKQFENSKMLALVKSELLKQKTKQTEKEPLI